MNKAHKIYIAIACTGILVLLGVFIFVQSKDKQTSYTEQTLGDSESMNNEASGTTGTNTISDKINVTIGSVSGTPGATVTIPVEIVTITEAGIGCCNFNIEFDNTMLEAVEVTTGDAIGSGALDWDYEIADSNGMITFLYACDNEKDAITKAGVFANIKFKITDNAPQGDYALTSGKSFSFGDPSINKIDTVFKDGQITVN